MMLKNILMVGIGGFAGSAIRYLVSVLMATPGLATGFPVATLTVNIAGSLLIGILIPVVGVSSWYYLCIAGFCGGFTTFSAFSLETVNMFREGDIYGALLFVLLSVACCVAATAAGLWLGAKLN